LLLLKPCRPNAYQRYQIGSNGHIYSKGPGWAQKCMIAFESNVYLRDCSTAPAGSQLGLSSDGTLRLLSTPSLVMTVRDENQKEIELALFDDSLVQNWDIINYGDVDPTILTSNPAATPTSAPTTAPTSAPFILSDGSFYIRSKTSNQLGEAHCVGAGAGELLLLKPCRPNAYQRYQIGSNGHIYSKGPGWAQKCMIAFESNVYLRDCSTAPAGSQLGLSSDGTLRLLSTPSLVMTVRDENQKEIELALFDDSLVQNWDIINYGDVDPTILTYNPTKSPSDAPTSVPTRKLSSLPTKASTNMPTEIPTFSSTESPSDAPTSVPTKKLSPPPPP